MKLFRNCPQEERKSCEDCPRLGKCIVRKLKRRFVKGVKCVFKQFKIRHIFLILLFVLMFFILLGNKTKSKECKDNIQVCNIEIDNNKYINTIQTSLVSNEVASESEATELSVPAKKKETKKKRRKNTNKVKKSSKVSDGSLTISKAEQKMIEKVVYQESRGEPYEGQVAVAAVVLNRYKFNKKKQSIEEIVTAPNQFANISGVTQKMLNAYPNCEKAVKEALKGKDPTKSKFSDGARYFFEPTLVSGYQKDIRRGIKVLKIGNHYFHNDFNE